MGELEKIIKKALDSEEYKELTKKTVTDQRSGFTIFEETKEMMDKSYEQYEQVMKDLGMIE